MNIVASRMIHVNDYPIFTKEDPQENIEGYVADCLATGVTHVTYSYDELPEHPHEFLSLKRKRKSKKMGEGPSGTVKSSAKVAKTSGVMKRPLGIILEAKGVGYENATKAEAFPSQKQKSVKSPIAKTSFSSDYILLSYPQICPTPRHLLDP